MEKRGRSNLLSSGPDRVSPSNRRTVNRYLTPVAPFLAIAAVVGMRQLVVPAIGGTGNRQLVRGHKCFRSPSRSGQRPAASDLRRQRFAAKKTEPKFGIEIWLQHAEPAHEYCGRRNRKPHAQSCVIDESSRFDRLFLCRTTDAGAATPCHEHIGRRQIKR